jgi:hypothetical protein
MLREEFGSTEGAVFTDLDHVRAEVARELLHPCGPLAEELIEKCCGSHSLGQVYWFLRNAGMDEREARAEFEQFLSGTLSKRVLDIAAGWIKAEQARSDDLAV